MVTGASSQVFATDIECVTHDFAPYVFVKNGQLTGIEIEIMKMLSAQMDVNFNVTVVPWSRALAKARNGTADCLFPAFRSEQRLRFLEYSSVPIHTSNLVFYKHKDSDFDYASLNDLNQRSIAVVRSFKQPDKIATMKQNKKVHIIEVTELNQSFELLQRNRVDLVLYNKIVGDLALSQFVEPQIVALEKPLESIPAYVTFSKHSEFKRLMPELDAKLKIILESEPYKKIVQRYISPSNFLD